MALSKIKTRWIEVMIIVSALGLLSVCFGAWDVLKPADSDSVYTWPTSIRANNAALEAVFGAGLGDVSIGGTVNVYNVQNSAYGATGNGVTDDAAAIQLAIDAIKVAGGGTLYFPTGVYLVNTSLDCTGFLGNVGIAYRSIHIMGDSINGSRIIGATTGTPVFDFTASGYCSMSNLRITGDVTLPPNVAILLARNNVAGSAGVHNFRRVFVEGYYTVGGIYCFASEENVFDNVRITMNDGSTATFCLALTQSNWAAIASLYEVILPGTQSMTRVTLLAPQFQMHDTEVTGTCLSLYGSVRDVDCYGGYMYSAAQSHVRMYAPASATSPFRILFYNLRTEPDAVGLKPDYSIFMTGATTGSFSEIIVDNAFLSAYDYEIYQDATASGTYSGTIDRVRSTFGTELKFNKVTNSQINVLVGDLTVDTSITQSEVTNYHTGTITLAGVDEVIERDFGGRLITSTAIPHVQTIRTLDNTGTPPITTGNLFITGGTTNITDFDDGVTGQIITIIAEHGITITDGTNIFLNGSVNFAMTATDTLTLICKADNKWYEVSRGDNGA